ncbi:MAG: hypothetical protein B7Z37_24080 [Verrucomicrobia bacterium 12-59-8]|nr:MAG: hypothetical protein B7Z37_24080 [Verrucomicrobia bacterium 12-59-8]
MGDRTYCNLVIRGKISPERFAELETRINANSPDADTQPGSGGWGFCEVNYGEPVNEGFNMQALADEFGVTFIWSWDAGYDYSPGIRFYRPGEPVAEFPYNGDDITVTVCVSDPGRSFNRLSRAFNFAQILHSRLDITSDTAPTAA